MTVKQITAELDQQTAIHTTARQIVELLDAARDAVNKLGGDGDAARERVLELVTEE